MSTPANLDEVIVRHARAYGWLPRQTAALATEIERLFVLVPRDEYTAEVEAARLRAIAALDNP